MLPKNIAICALLTSPPRYCNIVGTFGWDAKTHVRKQEGAMHGFAEFGTATHMSGSPP
jgi:hypothetical protein